MSGTSSSYGYVVVAASFVVQATIIGAIGPVLAGGVFDLINTYRPVFLFLILLLAFGVFALTRLSAYEPQPSKTE